MQGFGTSTKRSFAATRGPDERAALPVPQLAEPRGWWIAMALLPISLVAVPAAAQSGSAAVVYVGSEGRTLATGSIRRVYTEDMEIVYRIGVENRPARPSRARSRLGPRLLSRGSVCVVRSWR